MKLLLDQGLPRTAAELLNRAGIDTTHVGEIGYAAAEDDMILQLGRNEGYVIVTLDADFHASLALTGATEPSVIRIRIEGLKAWATAELLKTVLARCIRDLEHGAAVTVQQGRIRVRQLPLISSEKA
jgi:predicted nuclease of predicted toxin-antitoxin system